VAKESLATGKTLKEVVLEKGWLDAKRLKDILNPKTMTEPGIPGYKTKKGDGSILKKIK
jgi:aspartate ammonia-lyase